MNVFYVRPSNNGFYGIAEALQAQPGGVRLRTSLFRSTQFPLTYPLPKRLDRDMQGWFGLQAYDLVILAGLDPEVLSPKELRDLVAYVEHGGGLFVLGGQVSGDQRIGTWEPLASVLPVRMGFAPDSTVDAPAEIAQPHWITTGLPALRGRVQSVHAVEPVEDCEVLLQAGGHPLLAAAARGRGRVLFLNSYPQAAQTTDGLFFTDRFAGDLLRRCCAWLTGAGGAGFTVLDIPEAVAAGQPLALTVQAAPGMAISAVLASEEKTLAETTRIADAQPVSLALPTPADAALPQHLALTLELRDQEKLLDFCRTTVRVLPPVDLTIDIPDGAETYAPGMPFVAAINADPATACQIHAAIIDPYGDIVQTWEPLAGTELQWTVGDLASGTYMLRAQAVAPSGAVLRQVARSFAVVDPPNNEHFFPFVTEAFAGHGALTASAADLRRIVDDVAAHGFNVVTLGHVRYPHPLSHENRIRRAGERHAQEIGLRLATHGDLVPSFSRSAPPADCIRDTEAFDRSLREKTLPLLEAGKRVPRLFQMEILDEPLVAPMMICRCPRCLQAFERQYGYPMPDWEETCAPGRESERTDLLAFAGDYWAAIFRRCYEFKQQSGASFDVHHTFCMLTFGTFCSRYYWRDGFNWMPYCDRFDWDVYPYIYPVWRAHAELQRPNIRYHFAGHRSLARFHGKDMGHWLDLSDRNVPHWIPPVRASSELLYTAIGQNAKLVRTFWNLTFGRNNGVRRERWDALGEDLRKIGRYASVLTLAQKPHAPLAMLFPATDWALRHHTSAADLPPGIPVSDFPLKIDDAPFNDWFPYNGPLYNAYELLLRAFGEADLLPEQMGALPEQLAYHRAIAVWHTQFLSAACAAALVAFVKAGGLLLCDGVPEFDERGKPLEGFAALFGDDLQPLCDDLAAARRAVGQGETLLFNRDINCAYSDAVVSGDLRLRGAIEGAIRDFLAAHGVEPALRITHHDIEVDVLAGEACFFVVAVNHAETAIASTLEFSLPPSPVGFVFDLNDGLEREFSQDGSSGNVSVDLCLGERRGTILGCYTERPVKNAVRILGQQNRTITCEVAILNASGAPAAGHHPIELSVYDPTGDLRTRYGGRRATTGGRYRTTFTLAGNERPGTWTIELRDIITRMISRVEFVIE